MAGFIADRAGSRRQLLMGVVLFALTRTAGLWFGSLRALLGSRLLQGVAVALIMTAQTAFIGQQFAGAARATFMGLQIAATNLSGSPQDLLLAAGMFVLPGAALPLIFPVRRDGPSDRATEAGSASMADGDVLIAARPEPTATPGARSRVEQLNAGPAISTRVTAACRTPTR